VLFFNDPAALVGIAIALLVGLTFHEFSHAFLADQLGDHRPRALGRVSLNPVRHIDPMGAVMLLLVGFGWAKPVPVNPYALRPGRRGMSMVAAAGPLANSAVAIVAGVLFRLLDGAGIGGFALEAVWFTVLFNWVLAIFNLLPIPPLDGYNIVLPFLPPNVAMQVQRNAHYGTLVLLGLILVSYALPVPGPLSWIFQIAQSLTNVVIGA
jgi:Zn-dependent protease